MGTPSHSYGTSLAIWDHTVLPATRHKLTRPALTPASKLVLDVNRIFCTFYHSLLFVLWLQVSALGTSPVFASQHLGGPVRPPVGTNQPRRPRHDIADDARGSPADQLGGDDAERLGRGRLSRRLRPTRTAASLGSVLGRPHQARHAPSAASDQLSAVLYVV